jgi:UDP-N-acetylmuramate--alanine ligase
VEYAASSEEAIGRAMGRAREGDAILTLGAGNVSQLAPVVVEQLQGIGSRE